MADLDEMYLMIGEIRANSKMAIEWFDKHEQRDQERFDALALGLSALQIQDIRLRHVEAEILPLKEQCEEARLWKQRGIGALAVISIVSSGLTAIVSLSWAHISSLFGVR